MSDQKPISKSAILPVKFKLPKSKKLETIKFSTSPNPSDGNFNVIYQLARNIPVNLTFYTIEGKVAKRMLNLPAENKSFGLVSSALYSIDFKKKALILETNPILFMHRIRKYIPHHYSE